MRVVFKPAPGTEADRVLDVWKWDPRVMVTPELHPRYVPEVGELVALTNQEIPFRVVSLWFDRPGLVFVSVERLPGQEDCCCSTSPPTGAG